MASSSQKEAIAIVLDASPSMNTVCASSNIISGKETNQRNTEGKETRFECAKSAILDTISNLILQGKSNICAVVVVNTEATSHHLPSEAFPNVTEFNAASAPTGLLPPTVDFLKRLDATLKFDTVAVSGDAEKKRKPLSASFWDGIIVAADALSKTSKQKFIRRLIVYTDAANPVRNLQYMHHIMDGLTRMECKLEVVVVDFLAKLLPNIQVDLALTEVDDVARADESPLSDTQTLDESSKESEDNNSEMEETTIDYRIENVKFLQSAANFTGGSVSTMNLNSQNLYQTLGKKIPTSRQMKCALIIAPGLSVPVRYSILTSEAKFPSLKKFAVSLNQDGKAKADKFGEDITHDIIRTTTHRDPDRPNIELCLDQKAKAYCYGSSLIPIGDFDVEGLRLRSDTSISILKYCPVDRIPKSHFIGSPFVISDATPVATGNGLQEELLSRASVAIAALGQALEELKLCAICRFVKKKDDDPVTVALFPLALPRHSTGNSTSESLIGDYPGCSQSSKYALVFVQIPFIGDVIPLSLPSLAALHVSQEHVKACDDLVQALMLPPNTLESTTIRNPSLRSMYRTVMRRAINENHEIVHVRGPLLARNTSEENKTQEDPMRTPACVLSMAKDSIGRFRELFPIIPKRQIEPDKKGIKGKNKVKRKRWGEEED